MEEKYWFFLEPYIHVSIKSDAMLLYDTHSGESLQIESKGPIKLVNKIYEKESLGSIELKQSDLQEKEIYVFVNNVVRNKIGKLLNQNTYPIQPVVLLPILCLNLDVEKLRDKERGDLFLARDISKYLLDVNIILNNSCQQRCKQCQNYNKQFFCCSSDKTNNALSPDSLLDILRQISYFPVQTINITGGNIYQYQNLEKFSVTIDAGRKLFNFYVHYLNYQANPCIDTQKIHLLVNTPVNMEKLKEVYNMAKNKEVKYHLIAESEEQYEELESAMSEMGLEEYEVHPYYNGENLRFFKENVYLSKEDIIAKPIPMREIFRNQKLNANSFGSLYFLPNGDIKANLNEKVLGNVAKDRIIDIISLEMQQNTAWRKVRSSEPCNNCLYQYLCPPLSNYERVINKQNLCHVLK